MCGGSWMRVAWSTLDQLFGSVSVIKRRYCINPDSWAHVSVSACCRSNWTFCGDQSVRLKRVHHCPIDRLAAVLQSTCFVGLCLFWLLPHFRSFLYQLYCNLLIKRVLLDGSTVVAFLGGKFRNEYLLQLLRLMRPAAANKVSVLSLYLSNRSSHSLLMTVCLCM